MTRQPRRCSPGCLARVENPLAVAFLILKRVGHLRKHSAFVFAIRGALKRPISPQLSITSYDFPGSGGELRAKFLAGRDYYSHEHSKHSISLRSETAKTATFEWRSHPPLAVSL